MSSRRSKRRGSVLRTLLWIYFVICYAPRHLVLSRTPSRPFVFRPRLLRARARYYYLSLYALLLSLSPSVLHVPHPAPSSHPVPVHILDTSPALYHGDTHQSSPSPPRPSILPSRHIFHPVCRSPGRRVVFPSSASRHFFPFFVCVWSIISLYAHGLYPTDVLCCDSTLYCSIGIDSLV